MFNSHTTIEKLTAEFSLSAKAFRHLIKDELVFRRLTERDYRVTDKQPEQTWLDLYKQKKLEGNKSVVQEEEEQVATTITTTTTTTTTVEEQQVEAMDTTEESFAITQEPVEKIVAPVVEETIIAPVIEETTQEPTAEETTEEPIVEETVIPQEPIEEVTVASITSPTPETAAEEEEVKAETNESQPEETVVEEEIISEELKVESEPAPVEEEQSLESSGGDCPHLDKVSDSINEIKRIIYKNEKQSICDLCLSRTSSYLNMSDSCHTEACRTCLDEEVDDEEHFPVQLELSTGDLYCFKCMESDGNPRKLVNEKATKIMEYLKTPESADDLDKRRKAEHQLYVQELRREDMSLKHYLVEKQWGRTWMLFRTREGSPLPGKITNQKLARMNGTLDPNIRLPMDKFRPSPETHGDIVSERLWSYLVKAYGVQGRAYSEDDIVAPEYARLRVYVDDFKKSIHLYP